MISPKLHRMAQSKRSEAEARQARIDRIARDLVRTMPFFTRDAIAGDRSSQLIVKCWFGYDWSVSP